MSETIIDEIPSSNGLPNQDTNSLVRETGVINEDEETWLYGKQKNDENVYVQKKHMKLSLLIIILIFCRDNTAAPSIDEITTQEIDDRVSR